MTFLDTKGQHCRGCGVGENAVAARVSFTGIAANRSLRVHYHCGACEATWDEIFILAAKTKVIDLDDIVVELDDETDLA